MKRIIFTVALLLVSILNLKAQYFEWAKQAGGSNAFSSFDRTNDVAYFDGAVYVVGAVRGTPTIFGNLNIIPIDTVSDNGFVAKYSADGTLIWAKLIDGLGTQEVRSVAVLNNGDVVICGDAMGFFNTNAAVIYEGNTENYTSRAGAFIIKIDSNANLNWIKKGRHNTTSTSGLTMSSLDVDSNYNIYATGLYRGQFVFDNDSTSGTPSFQTNQFMMRTDSAGNVDWIKNSTTSSFSTFNSVPKVAVGDSGNSYYVATPNGSVTYGSLTSTGTSRDFVVVKCDSNGTSKWIRRAGSSSFNDFAGGICFKNQAIYVSGRTFGVFTVDTVTNIGSGFNNVCFFKLNTAGRALYAKVSNSSGFFSNNGSSIRVSDSGDVFIGGLFNSVLSFDGVTFSNINTNLSLFVVKYIESQNLFQWAAISTATASFSTIAPEIAIDTDNNVYVGGQMSGLTQFGNKTLTGIGIRNIYVVKIRDCSRVQATAFATNGITKVCPGTPVQLQTPNDTSFTYQWIFNNGFTTGPIPGETDTIYSAPVPGDYSVIINQGGCIDTSQAITITNFTPPTVSLTALSSACIDAPPIVLTGGSPVGGAYSGSGVVGNIFSPSVAGVGTAIIKYVFTDTNGCSDSTTANINVQPAPSVFFVPFVSTACSGDSPFALTGGFPAGGTYSGAGVIGGFFSPSSAGIGPHTIIYSFSNGQGCGGSDSITIVVSPSPTVTLAPISTTCNTAGAFPLTGGSPIFGGTYSGPGVAFNSFFPQFLTPGIYPITYTVTQNGCSGAATQNIQVDPPAIAALTPLTGSCATDPAFTLSGGSPAGGIYIGAGVSNNTTFTPTIAGIGLHQIGYVVNNACGTDTAFQNLVVSGSLSGAITVVANVSCNGGTDGALAISASGGTSPLSFNWSNGASSDSINGLTSGNYVVTISDSVGCNFALASNITEPASINISTTSTSVTCSGGANSGSATATISGGSTPYTYAWSAGTTPTSASTTGLSAGSYTLTVTDASGCTNTGSVTVNSPAGFSVGITKNDPTCNGLSDGIATATITGGTAPLTYNWNSGGATSSATNTGLTAGIYSVTVNDAGGCATAGSITLIQPLVLAATASAINVGCNGANTGSASVATTGGTLPYTYAWNAGGATTSDTNTGLAAGTYTVAITDANGCANSATATVNQPTSAPSVTFTNVSDITCNGADNATATVAGSGGTVGYTYAWSAGSSTAGLTNTAISAGTFTVTLTDGNGCTATADSTIVEPTALSDSISLTPISCNNGNDGAATATVSGGTAGYTYLWSNGSTASSISSLGAGSYSLITNDQNGCADTSFTTLTEPTPLTTSSAIIVNASCNGTADGSITITGGIGGAGPYSFNWNSGATTAGLILLTAGDYTVTIADANNCMLVDTLTVTEPNAINLNIAGTNVACGGGNTGNASAAVTGGSTPYTYLWSGGTSVTSANNGNLVAGTYILTVTDANNCTASDTIVITEPNALTLNITSNDAICNGATNGQASAFGNGGTTPYTFAWSNLSGNNTQINLSAGTYTVTLTDANNCSTNGSVIIGEPAPLSANGTATNEQCVGDSTGSISLSTIGGTPTYTYAWSNGNTTSNPSNLGAGTYTVTITDANFCSTNASFTIGSNFSKPVVNLGPDTTICVGAYMLDAGAGFVNYQWSVPSGNTSQINVTTSNTYSVVVTDVNSCTGTDAAVITVTPAIQTTLAATNSTCGQANGAISVTATGGTPAFTYSWSNAGQTATINGLAAGIYSVTVSDANGCSSVASTGVSTTNGPNITVAKTDISCFGASDGIATATPVGGGTGISYSWSNAGSTATISNLTAGTYTVTATDILGCQTFGSAIVNQPPQVTLVTSNTIDSCADGNGSAVVFVSGSFGAPTYAWNDASNQTTAIASGLAAGTYIVTVSDGAGCTFTSSATVTAPTALNTIGTVTNVDCQGGSTGAIATTTSGGTLPFNYAWNNGSGTNALAGIAAGNYTLTVTDNYGCTTLNSYTIGTNFSTPTVSLGNDSTLCAGAFTLNAGTGFASYNWNSGQAVPSISVNGSGSASVTVTDVNGCQASDTVNLVFQPAINITLAAADANCSQSNGAVNATVTGGGSNYTYSWSNAITTDTNTALPAGLYTVTVTDAIGCSNTATGTVGNINGPTGTLAATDATCFGGATGSIASTVAGGTGTLTYSWSNSTAATSISSLTAGVYNLTATDAAGCQTIISDTINEPAAIFSSTTSAADNCGLSSGTATVFAGGGTGTLTYLWSDAGAQTTSVATGLNVGSYSVTITDASGCSSIDGANVSGNAAIAISGTTTNVTCQGGSNGSVSVASTGGLAPFNYAWNGGQAGASLNNIVAGTYSVTVTDVNGCSANDNYSVGFDFNNPTVSLGADTTACAGNLALNAGSGFSGYTWNTSDITPTLSVNTGGNYSVTVTDVNGCTGLDTIDVNFHPAINLATSVIDAACGQANGIASANATGGSGTFLFSWSNASTSQTITGLSAGIYTVTATDGNACIASITSAVSNANGPSVNTTTTNVSCFGLSDGGANAIATGGSGSLSYLWSNGQSTSQTSGLTAGTYNVTVTDTASCQDFGTVIILQPTQIVMVASTTQSTCGASDGSATVNASGGSGALSYLWNDPNTQSTPTANSLAAGIYVVTITDAGGCAVDTSLAVNDINGPSITLTSQNELCGGDQDGWAKVIAAGTGPFAYSWNDPNFTATDSAGGLGAGNYFVFVSDVNGCQTIGGVTINTNNPSPVIDLGTDGTSCSDTILDAGAGFAIYTWSNGSGTSTTTVTQTGTYTVTVFNAVGCSASDDVTITISPAPSIDLAADTTVCIPQAITLDAGTGFASYIWNTGETTQAIAPADTGSKTYGVVATTAAGCSSADSINVIFDICLDIEPIASATSFNVYPNPSEGQLFLEANNTEIESISITDMAGRSVAFDAVAESGRININVAERVTGIYAVRFIADGQLKMARVAID